MIARPDGIDTMSELIDEERALPAVDDLRGNATMEDAIERLCLVAKVQEGREVKRVCESGEPRRDDDRFSS